MRKTILLTGSLMLIVFLVACGGDDNSSDDSTESKKQIDKDNQNDENVDKTDSDDVAKSADDMQAQMDKLDYKEIEIEVDYRKDKEYEIEIEQDEGEPIEAKIEDEVNDEFLKGPEAFNKLYPMVKELSISKDTSKDEAIEDVLNTFDLNKDYDKFELEITFNDGEKLEYEDK